MKREIREGRHIPLKDLDTVAAADVVCNFGSEAFVVHQEKVNFPGVADQELLEAVGKKVTGLLVATITNLRKIIEKIHKTKIETGNIPWAWEAGP